MTLALLKHSITKVIGLLININDDGDNDEKTKKFKKPWWEYLKTWLVIFQEGIFWVGIFRKEDSPAWRLIGGNFPGEKFLGRGRVSLIPRQKNSIL